jgi:hypothetical protein
MDNIGAFDDLIEKNINSLQNELETLNLKSKKSDVKMVETKEKV